MERRNGGVTIHLCRAAALVASLALAACSAADGPVSSGTGGQGTAAAGGTGGSGGTAGTGGVAFGGSGGDDGVAALFWAEGDDVRSASLEGDDVSTVVTGSFPTGIAIEGGGQRLFWTDNGTDTITSIDFLGADPQQIYQADDTMANPAAVAVDRFAQKLFWAESDRVLVGDLDGSNVATLALAAFSRGVVVDRKTGLVYWTNEAPPTISRAAYDGSAVEVVHTAPSGAERPGALALDSSNGKMFWTAQTLLKSANLDGSGVVVIATTTVASLTGVAVDPPAQHVLWTNNDGDSIMRANYDGSDATAIYTSGDPYSNPRGAVSVFRSLYDEIK